MQKDIKARALRLMAMREHSRFELERKLAAYGTPADIVAVLERLRELDLQSDERFAHSYVRAHAERLGAQRLRYELAQRGVAQALIDGAMAVACTVDEIERARDIWMRKFGVLPDNAKDWARQARFLQSRGFSPEVIRKLLKDPFDESA